MTMRATLAALALACASGSASAFNFFSLDDDHALKWGDTLLGTPGGVVTWSLIPNGTPLGSGAPDYVHGLADWTNVFNQVGDASAVKSMLEQAFAAWSAAANVQFQFVSKDPGSLFDDGTPLGAPAAAGQVVGHIRIGAYEIDGNTGAIGFAPSTDSTDTLAGDVVFNARGDIYFFAASGAEGDAYPILNDDFFYQNEFQGLAAHELGHALGLDHTDVTTALMCGAIGGFDGSQCYWADFDGDGTAPITRLPKADDIAGIQTLYGPAPVPEPQTWVLILAGLGLVALGCKRRGVRLHAWS